MNQNLITCNVCQDLIPLVKDGVASEDSQSLVLAHISNCPNCSAMYYDDMYAIPKPELDDRKNLRQIKNKLSLLGLFILICGAFIGVYLSDSMGVFYNFIIMPFLGTLGYFIFSKKCFIIPCGVFALSYLWLFITYYLENHKITMELFSYPMFYTIIYTFLTVVGIIIGVLLKFAFHKGEIKE